MYLAMDTVTLVRSALDAEEYRSVVKSAAATELWCGGLHLLEEVCNALLPKARSQVRKQDEQIWRTHYDLALERLQAEGIKTTPDPEADAARYIALRHEWEPYLSRLLNYLEYDRRDVFPNHG
jgi:protoheme ferro-lyase